MTSPSDQDGYFTLIADAHRGRFASWADVCESGRHAYFTANNGGFDANPGTEAEHCAAATRRDAWPGGRWPPGPAESMHQVGLMLANSAAERLGEIGAMLRAGEVFWLFEGIRGSLPAG